MSGHTLFAVVLAAGRSRRFGSTKQLASLAGTPLVTGVVRTAESVCGACTVVIVGNDWQKVAAACEPLSGYLAVNPDYATGLGGSIATGVAALGDSAQGVLMLLADQPLVTAAHLQDLIDLWRSAPEEIVASAYAGTAGPPVIFPQAYFGVLKQLSGDRGAKDLLASNAASVRTISCMDAAVDIDRPADLENL